MIVQIPLPLGTVALTFIFLPKVDKVHRVPPELNVFLYLGLMVVTPPRACKMTVWPDFKLELPGFINSCG